MLAQLLLTGLALGAPDYTKKVMVDPNYRPARTPQQIATTLARPRRVRAAQPAGTTSTVVYRTEVRRRSWVWPVLALGLTYGTYYALHDHYDDYYRYRGNYGYRRSPYRGGRYRHR